MGFFLKLSQNNLFIYSLPSNIYNDILNRNSYVLQGGYILCLNGLL